MSLEALAAKYGTDKLGHGYIPFYEQHLPKEPKRILEIGVLNGASLHMWAEHYPNAEIFGLDLFADVGYKWDLENEFDKKYSSRVKLIKGNQCNWLLLEELRKFDFDVIIDDGSHNSRDQMMTFFGLFNGKHYFIEDLHCNNDDFFSQGLPRDFSASFLFSDIKIASNGTIYEKVVQFDDPAIDESNKIVCIKNIV